MNAITPVIEGRLRALVPMLASNHDGEVVAAARTLDRTLHSVGLDLHDLARLAIEGGMRGPIEPRVATPMRRESWRSVVAFCARHLDKLKPREASFVRSLAEKTSTAWSPSPKQRDWLFNIYMRLEGGTHA